jgi:hypothetical protein
MANANLDAEGVDMCCAACGIAEVDDIKLMECDACDLVRYCSDECQQDHSQQHEQCAKNGRLNYVTRNYLGNPKAPILVTVRSAFYRYRFNPLHHRSWVVSAK